MKRMARNGLRWAITLLAGSWMLQAGCVRILQQEIEVLFAPDANPSLIRGSFLVNALGPQILSWFN
ncbi:MAG: hypothetical protein AMXMBFR13_22040 [Phycisphaerae bacterium]|jgi:hypothetical protein